MRRFVGGGSATGVPVVNESLDRLLGKPLRELSTMDATVASGDKPLIVGDFANFPAFVEGARWPRRCNGLTTRLTTDARHRRVMTSNDDPFAADDPRSGRPPGRARIRWVTLNAGLRT